MEEFQFTRALSYDFGALANMFTEAFTGYYFPMTMAPDALANHWRLYHIDGARSLVMRDSQGDVHRHIAHRRAGERVAGAAGLGSRQRFAGVARASGWRVR